MSKPSRERLLGFAEGMKAAATVLTRTQADIEGHLPERGFGPDYCCNKSMRMVVESVAKALTAEVEKMREKI